MMTRPPVLGRDGGKIFLYYVFENVSHVLAKMWRLNGSNRGRVIKNELARFAPIFITACQEITIFSVPLRFTSKTFISSERQFQCLTNARVIYIAQCIVLIDPGLLTPGSLSFSRSLVDRSRSLLEPNITQWSLGPTGLTLRDYILEQISRLAQPQGNPF